MTTVPSSSTFSHLDRDHQIVYLAALPVEVDLHRRRTGLPQWVILEEAQRTSGLTGPAGCDYDTSSKGHCLVTWKPERLSPDARRSIDIVLALTSPDSSDGLIDLVAEVAGLARVEVARALRVPTGMIVVAQRDRPRELATVGPARRSTRHLRHEHKYGTIGVTDGRAFHFRDDRDRLSGAVAHSLGELRTEIARCPSGVLLHHLPRHHISRWVADVFGNDPLAKGLALIESGVERTALSRQGRTDRHLPAHRQRPVHAGLRLVPRYERNRRRSGPTLNAAQFLSATSDAQIGLIITAGVPGSSMTSWGPDYGGPLTGAKAP